MTMMYRRRAWVSAAAALTVLCGVFLLPARAQAAPAFPYPWVDWSVVPILFVPRDWSATSAEVQTEATELREALQEVREYYGTQLGGVTFQLENLTVLQAYGYKEAYGITWNGRDIYKDGVEIGGQFFGAVSTELVNRGYPAQAVDGYSVVVFVKGAGGFAGALEWTGADSGLAMLGDWAIDSIQGSLGEEVDWWSGRRRQTGAVAHELGHTFNMPHPDYWGLPMESSVMGTWWHYPYVGFNERDYQQIYTTKQNFFRTDARILLSHGLTGTTVASFPYGQRGDWVVMGDWNGDGVDTPATVRAVNGRYRWMIRNSNTAGAPEVQFDYGRPGDILLAGDWNGDRVETPVIARPVNGEWAWYPTNSNDGAAPFAEIRYGSALDRPVVGDWNGDGIDTIGIVHWNRSTLNWALRNSNTAGAVDIAFTYGITDDQPVVGDWNGDGRDTPGVVRRASVSVYCAYGEAQWRLSDALGGSPSRIVNYGCDADRPVVGDWNGDRTHDAGVARRY